MTRHERAELTAAEQKIIDLLQGKSRAEQDQIIFDLERKLKNGNTLRTDNTGNGIV